MRGGQVWGTHEDVSAGKNLNDQDFPPGSLPNL